MPARRTAILMLVATTASWGMSFPLMQAARQVVARHGTGKPPDEMPLAAALLAPRFALAFALLLLVRPGLFRAAGRREWLLGLAVGACFVAGMFCQIAGLGRVPASRSAFVTSMTVVLTPAALALWRRRWPPVRVWLAAGLALAGVFALALPAGGEAPKPLNGGDAVTLLGAAFFTGQMLLVDLGGKGANGAALTPGMFAATAGLAALAWQQFGTPTDLPVWRAACADASYWAITAALAVFCSVMAFLWMNRYQSAVSATTASVVYTMEPVFAALCAFFLPALLSAWCGIDYANERFTWPMAAGGALILAASWVAAQPAGTTSNS